MGSHHNGAAGGNFTSSVGNITTITPGTTVELGGAWIAANALPYPILEDFDGDRRLDLMWSSMGFADQMRFLHSRGDGTFEDRTREAGLTGEVGGLNMIQADYDNDGDLDVLVLRGGWLGSEGRFPLSLLRNDGKGHFSDVTKAAGLGAYLLSSFRDSPRV